jgi:superfamily II DNA/RNA helicase
VRFATLEKFKAGEIRLLCCSDVAARGLDIGGLSHVFNFDVPHHAEDYVHRIGRTGRAGREGRAFTLATGEDRIVVEAIEKLTGHAIPRIVVDGLDVIDWSASSGRGRGRGRGKAAPGRPEPKPAAAAAASADDAAPAARPRSRSEGGRGRRPTRDRATQPELVAIDPADAPQPAIAALRPEPARPELARAEPPRRPEPPLRPERGPRRDDRGRPRRDDDLGPAVLGFGDDVPAFMLVAARPHGHAPEPAYAEEMES